VRRGGAAGVTVAEAAARLADTGLARVALRADDVRVVLDALVADGAAERVARGGAGGCAAYAEDPAAARARARGAAAGSVRPAVDAAASAAGGPAAPPCEGPPPPPPLAGLPCGVCPVARECSDGGAVSPATCEYFDAWLDF
jgi:hypothetical protein